MAYDVRLSTETEVSLQKCNYMQIMVFPVVVTDQTDAEKERLAAHWMIHARASTGEAPRMQRSVSFSVLSFPIHFSAVSIGHHPKPHGQPLHRAQPRSPVSPRPPP